MRSSRRGLCDDEWAGGRDDDRRHRAAPSSETADGRSGGKRPDDGHLSGRGTGALTADATIGIYRRHAAAFDRQRLRVLSERDWLDRFLGLLPDGAAVLDLGCGMGEPIARYLIGRGCRMTGVDTSAPLLALCRTRFPGHTWIEADMRGLALGERFDGILAWDSFFFLPPDQQHAMVPVFAAHAKPGAALMFTSGPEAGEAYGTFEGETLYHASLDPDDYRSLLTDNGFTVEHHVAEDPDCDRHTVWLARRVPA